MVKKRGSILNEERRRAIVDFVNQNGRAVVRELADQFRTSEITIRRDLEMLHERGMLYRTHGGALPIRAAAEQDRNLTERELQHPREKMRIAAAAARMVRRGESIVLDSGSTTTAIARAIRDIGQLTVITNAINIAAELADSNVDVILTGGLLRKNSFSLVGPMAEETLRHLKADILFLGIEGFDVKHGVSTPNMLEAQLNRTMVDIVSRVVAVCDSSKFGRRSLSLIVPTSRIHAVITDKQISKSDLKVMQDQKIDVILV
jgi:DeoR family transcriptional regulator of aga operon